MVVFFCPHLGALWEVCTLRFTRFRNQSAVFLTSDTFLKSDYPARFLKNKVFDKIIGGKVSVKNDMRDEAALQEAVVRKYDELLQKNGIALNEVTQFLLWADVENLFSIYLSVKGIPHTIVELEEGQFKKDSRYSVNVRFLGYDPCYETLHRKYYALNGEGGNLISRILLDTPDAAHGPKDECYDFSAGFSSLPQEDKEVLIDSFDLKELREKNFDLFLLNSAGYTLPATKLSREAYYLVYQMIADYLDTDNLLIKDHPHTHDFAFDEAFPKAKVVPGLIPVEFFALTHDFKLNCIYSANSTGGDKLAGHAKAIVRLGDAFLREFRLLHKLWAALALCRCISSPSTRYHYFGIDKQFVNNANTYMFGNLWKQEDLHCINPEILKGDIVVFVGAGGAKYAAQLRKALLNAPQDVKAVFLTESAIPFGAQATEDEILPYILPIAINKKPTGKTAADLEDEFIYFYCKDEAVRKKAGALKADKVLPNTEIKVSAHAEVQVIPQLKEYARAAKINMLTEEVSSLRAEVKALTQKMEAMVGFFKTLDKGE